ncbi:hypothetical protein JR316_0006798 [Psilocybe cubensis]|uniref:Uncharacterized protein n=2 Tax=Psilocybe cubensis TaxID=181762 RepID=A0ACB8GZ12_PSICU|nr:hypothetical protein JR316_0006798 [Psilocybe cubensis]KAH9480200.1 hypothetical protein JR316_0006798 [Psilocybe cubensis]
MLFCYFTLPSLFIAVLSFCYGALAGPCMPCQASNRRYTPWDRRITIPRGVYSPNITNPTGRTVWIGGTDVVVTWDHDDMPAKPANPKGTLLLGYLDDGSEDEHLDVEHPLAADFDLKKGFVTFKCPEVVEREQYIVVLVGNSGNRSPTFKIKN